MADPLRRAKYPHEDSMKHIHMSNGKPSVWDPVGGAIKTMQVDSCLI